MTKESVNFRLQILLITAATHELTFSAGAVDGDSLCDMVAVVDDMVRIPVWTTFRELNKKLNMTFWGCVETFDFNIWISESQIYEKHPDFSGTRVHLWAIQTGTS